MNEWDVAVVGAGAAGLMTAITCGRAGLRVLLLDGQKKIGAKILMSGGTRCNLTNQQVSQQDYNSENSRFVRNVLAAFPSERAIELFKEMGVDVVLEEGGKYFPSTHSGQTVLNALIRETQKSGVSLEKGLCVKEVSREGGSYLLRGDAISHRSKTVVLCTGGLSYPTTGSDGAGYAIAKSFDHSIIPTTPALTPLLSDDPDWKSLSGISLPVEMSLWLEKKKIISYEGFLLFTHFGFSGPVVLDISRHWARSLSKLQTKILVNFLPMFKEDDFLRQFKKMTERKPHRTLKHYLSEMCPERFASMLLKKVGIHESVVLNQVRRQDREALINLIFQNSLSIKGVFGYSKAEVTAGGVDLSELDSASLESKLQPGLFFAGEVLDADGRIGGFNFQWAWASGVVAGRGVVKRVKREE